MVEGSGTSLHMLSFTHIPSPSFIFLTYLLSHGSFLLYTAGLSYRTLLSYTLRTDLILRVKYITHYTGILTVEGIMTKDWYLLT